MLTKASKFLEKLRFFFLFFAITLGLWASVFACYDNTAKAQIEAEPNEYIFQVVLKPNWRISEALFAYEINGKYYFPLQQLADGFEFFAVTDTSLNFAEGYASTEDNTFSIDGRRFEIIVKGKKETINEDSILVSDFIATDDLYVQKEVLEKLWPVTFSLDLSVLTVFSETEEELSFMRDKARREKRELVIGKRAARNNRVPTLPEQENPYSWFGRPAFDYQANYRFDTLEDDLIGTNIITGVQQFGKLYADYSANYRLIEGEIERPDNIRLRLTRRSEGDEYLVPAIRRFEFGDVSLRQKNLIANSVTGRGITFSNDNRQRVTEFDSITIEGSGPPGWEIELYNNNELIDFGEVPEDGRYFFEDVVLNFGNNEIRTLFFGPQGQVREETQSFTAGANMLRPGELKYSAGLLDNERNFILLDNAVRTSVRGVAKTVDAGYGVTKWLTLSGNYSEIPYADKDRKYFTGDAAFSTPIGLFDTGLYSELGGGNALDLSYVTSIFDVRTNLGLAFYNDFESTLSALGDNTKTFEGELELSKIVRPFSIPFGLKLRALHTERKSGNIQSDINFTQTYSRSGIRVSHNIRSRFLEYAHGNSNGRLSATVREGPWQIRGGLNYILYPEAVLSNGNGQVRYKTPEGFQIAVNGSHNFEDSTYGIGLQLGQKFEDVLGSFDISHTRDEGWDFILRATTSLHPYTKDNDYTFSSRSKKDTAPVKAFVFLDKNVDGIFNEDDEPLPNVRLKMDTVRSKTMTDESGYIIASAPEGKLTNIYIDVGTLEDPYYIPNYEGFSVVPRRGSMIETSFPIIETGSVEGTAYKASNNRIVPGLSVDLVDIETNEAIMTVETAYDGFYAFEYVPPGNYRLVTNETHQVQLQDNSLSVIPGDLYVYGHDVFIDDRPSRPKPVESEELEEKLPAQSPEPSSGEDVDTLVISSNIDESVKETEDASTATELVAVRNPRFKNISGKNRFVLDVAGAFEYEIQEGPSAKNIDIVIKNALLEDTISQSEGSYAYQMKAQGKDVVISLSGEESIQVRYALAIPSQDGETTRFLVDLQ